MMVLRNATLLHLHPPSVVEGADVVVEGGRIASAGPGAARSAGRADRMTDLAGKLLMPGLVCGHTHLYSALARGILARISPSTDFVSTLANFWWRLDRALDEETVRASGLVGCLEAVRAGCTAVIDHHASPSFIDGSLDVLRECFEQVGLRGVLCYEATDRNGREGLRAGIEESRRFARSLSGGSTASSGAPSAGRASAAAGGAAPAATGLVEAMIGAHAPFTLSDEGLEALADAVRETGRGFHIHVSEDAFDPSFSHRFHGVDPLARLDRHGLLSDRSLVAHGVRLTPAERELLGSRGAFLAHQARSNMNNAVGYNAGLPTIANVVLGTDGIGADMLEEAKFAYFRHRETGGPLGPGDFARFLQQANVLLGRCFGTPFGRIEPGYAADLVILDYPQPTPLVPENIGGHLAFGLSSAHVETVIVAGRIVMEGRRFAWDAEAVYRHARESARRLWHRMESR